MFCRTTEGTVHRTATVSGCITGFIFSDTLAASFSDVSDELKPELLSYLEAKGVDSKVRCRCCFIGFRFG
jgi:hypothetical protein